MWKTVPLSTVKFRHNPWQTVKDFVRETGAEGAISAGFFQRGDNHPHNSEVLGMVAWDGKSAVGHGYDRGWWDPAAFWHGVIKWKGAPPKIEKSPQTNWQYPLLDEVEWAVGMGPIVLKDGRVQVLDSLRFPGVNPVTKTERVGFGIGGDTAVFAYLGNATATEMGQYLKDAGAVDGILSDGGSSASYEDGSNSRGSQLVPNTLLFSGEGEKNMKIYLDPGHGGSDPGATGNGLQEKKLNLEMGLKLRDQLEANYICAVLMSRETDEYRSWDERTNRANEEDVDLFFSIHCNAHSDSAVNGYEDFAHPLAPSSTRNIQKMIHPYCAKPWTARGRRNRGSKTANFVVLRRTAMAAVLVEHGFITNSTDASLLKQDYFLDELVIGMRDGIADALDLKPKEQVKPPDTSDEVAQLTNALEQIRNIIQEVL